MEFKLKPVYTTALLAILISVPLAYADDNGESIDPFSGIPTNIEDVRAQIDLTKAQSALLEEKSKKAKNAFFYVNSDKISSVELKKTLSQAEPPGVAQYGGVPVGGFPPEAALPPPIVKIKKSVKPADNSVELPHENIAAPVFVQAHSSVIGVVQTGDDLAAMVSRDGGVVYVKQGGTIDGAVVTKITVDGVYLNGAKSASPATPLFNVDKQPVIAKNGSGSQMAAPFSGGLPPLPGAH